LFVRSIVHSFIHSFNLTYFLLRLSTDNDKTFPHDTASAPK